MRRSSIAGGSMSMFDTMSYSSCDRLLESDPSERINPQPCVPSVVTTCIKYAFYISYTQTNCWLWMFADILSFTGSILLAFSALAPVRRESDNWERILTVALMLSWLMKSVSTMWLTFSKSSFATSQSLSYLARSTSLFLQSKVSLEPRYIISPPRLLPECKMTY